jgi:hypothetical protein
VGDGLALVLADRGTIEEATPRHIVAERMIDREQAGPDREAEPLTSAHETASIGGHSTAVCRQQISSNPYPPSIPPTDALQ